MQNSKSKEVKRSKEDKEEIEDDRESSVTRKNNNINAK